MLLFEGVLDSIIYARDNFLKANGHIFPNIAKIKILHLCDQNIY